MEDLRRMYGDLAWTWPIISQKEHYITEAGQFVQAIRKHARMDAKTLLDLGCGGGHNDWTLKTQFRVTGVDISENMLALARELNPEVTYLHGDMRTARLGQTFDAVVIADSIDYMLTEDDLRAAFATAHAHLNPGGVFCTYAEATRENPPHNKVYTCTGAQGDVEIAFYEHSYDPDPADSTYESVFAYFIRRRGELEIQTDRHILGVFPEATWERLLRDVGFEVHRMQFTDPDLDNPIPFFACVK